MTISHLLVFIQVITILILALTGPVFPDDKVNLIIEILFALFGIWAMSVFKFRFSIFPHPKEDVSLMLSGPYRIVRHPMYSAVIFITLIWLLNYFTVFRAMIWICLVVTLHYKSSIEEKLLLSKHPEYITLMNKTKKFIPFLY